MTGLRVGYIYGPKEIVSFLWLVHQCALAQHIALAALKGSQEFVKDMVQEFDRRRQLIHKRLMDIGGFNCSLPKGAFYVFPSVKDFGMNLEEFASFL